MITYGSQHYPGEDTLSQFHNFYEHLVLEQIMLTDREAFNDEDMRADVACVALNHLPPRYVRHDVDMSFFLSPQEYSEMEAKIGKAVKDALQRVRKNKNFHKD